MMDNLRIIKIEVFSHTKHEVANFCCGYESLDKYIKTYAETNANRGLGSGLGGMIIPLCYGFHLKTRPQDFVV